MEIIRCTYFFPLSDWVSSRNIAYAVCDKIGFLCSYYIAIVQCQAYLQTPCVANKGGTNRLILANTSHPKICTGINARCYIWIDFILQCIFLFLCGGPDKPQPSRKGIKIKTPLKCRGVWNGPLPVSLPNFPDVHPTHTMLSIKNVHTSAPLLLETHSFKHIYTRNTQRQIPPPPNLFDVVKPRGSC